MSARIYTSARERLIRLGELGSFFEGRHAMQIFNWTSKTAAQYLWTWSRQGLVKPLGGKSDIFFNLVADPRAPDHVEAAIRRVMPGAVVGFANVLHSAGITTQRPGMLHLLVRPDERRLSIEGAEVEPRPPTWWSAVDSAGSVDPGTEETLARLRIGAAVADSALSGGLAPDDIDLAEISPTERRRALKLLTLLGPDAPHTSDLERLYAAAWQAARR